ncbi:hypothetical protein FCV25MIE_28400 [Fagus crenata]
MDANKTLTSAATELTRERDCLVDNLTKLKVDALAKDEEQRKTVESYRKALDQLKALSEQMESTRSRAVEEYKSSDACDDDNTKYFLVGFELLRK